MKVVFLSNYFSHHQKPFCKKLYELLDGDFMFVSTSEITQDRKKLGWSIEDAPFVFVRNAENCEMIDRAITDADIVIIGSAEWELVTNRLKAGKIVFRYSERIFKNGYEPIKVVPRIFKFRRKYDRYKSLYLMSAGAFTTLDYAMHGTFLGRSYKWGYFPDTKKYNIDQLLDNKTDNSILWCGRFLDWKHPDDAVFVAKKLKENGYNFNLTIIGSGELKEALIDDINKYNLSDCVTLLDSMPADSVREYMEKASIYLFTSDFREGWGAVLNESMNSGCAVVASHAIGAVPFLTEHNVNALVYQNGDKSALYNNVKSLLDDKSKRAQLGKNAYNTITSTWNAETAAQRFVEFSNEILQKGKCDKFNDGPCSKASIIKNNWFKANNIKD